MSLKSYDSPTILNGSQQYITTNDIPYQGQFSPNEGIFPKQQQQQPMFSQQPAYPSVATPVSNSFPQQPAIFVPISGQNYMNSLPQQQQQQHQQQQSQHQIPTQQPQSQRQQLVSAYSPNYTPNPVSGMPTNVPNPQQYSGSMFPKQEQQPQQQQHYTPQNIPQQQAHSRPMYMNHAQQGLPFDPAMQQWMMAQTIPAGSPAPTSTLAPVPAPPSISSSTSYSQPVPVAPTSSSSQQKKSQGPVPVQFFSQQSQQQQQQSSYIPQQSIPYSQSQINLMRARRYSTKNNSNNNENGNNGNTIDLNIKSIRRNNNNIDSANINCNTKFTSLEKSKETLNSYILDFLKKANFSKSANIFKQEAKLDGSKNMLQFQCSNTSKGFLTEWWQIFWDLFNTTTRRGGSEVINKYYQIVSNQRRRDNTYKGQMLYAAKLQNLAEQRGEYGEQSIDPLSLLSLLSNHDNKNGDNNNNSDIPNFEFDRKIQNNDYNNTSNNNSYTSNGRASSNNSQNMTRKQVKPNFNSPNSGNIIPQQLPEDQQSKFVQLHLQQVQQQQMQQRQMQVQLQLQRQIQQQRQQQQQQQQQSSMLYSGQVQTQSVMNSPMFQKASPYENVNNISQWRSSQIYNNPTKSIGGFNNSATDYSGNRTTGNSNDRQNAKSPVSKFSKQDQLDIYNNYNDLLNGKKVTDQHRQNDIKDIGEDKGENDFKPVSNENITLKNNPDLSTNDINDISFVDSDLNTQQNTKASKSRIKNKKPSPYDTKKKTVVKPDTPSVSSPLTTTSKTPRSKKSKSELRIDFQSDGMMSNNNNNMRCIKSSVSNSNTVLSPASMRNNGFNTNTISSYVSDILTFTPQQEQASPRTGDLPSNTNNTNANIPQSSFSADTNYTNSNNKDKDSSHKSRRSSTKNTPMAHENGSSNTLFSQNKGIHQNEKIDNATFATIKSTSADPSFGVIDIRKKQFLMEEPGDGAKEKSIQHSRKRKEVNKNEKLPESSRKRGRKPKKLKNSKQGISEKMLDKNKTLRSSKQQDSSEINKGYKRIMEINALSDTEEIFEENGENEAKLTSLANPMNPDILQASFGDDADDFAGFNFSNVDVSTTEQSGLNAVMPNGDSARSYSILPSNPNIKKHDENDTTNKKDTSPNNLEDGDIDFNFMNWQ